MSSRRKKVEANSAAYLYWDGNSQPIPLFDKFQFGRMESFNNPAVSRTHFTIMANEHGVYFIIDHESLAGTRVNGEQIKPGEWHEVEEGAIIGVGPYKFEFSFKPIDERSTKNLNKAPMSLVKPLFQEKPDTNGLALEKGSQIASPMRQLPRREIQNQNRQANEDNSYRLLLFLIICVVIIVLTFVIVRN